MSETASSFFDPRVAVIECASSRYLETPPFHPDVQYPEYRFGADAVSAEPNPAYAGVRDVFRVLDFDVARYGTPQWNPLGALIRPGDRVVVKPNYVQHVNYSERDYNSVVVHTSVIRAVIDYVLIALAGRGEVVIADAPLWDADFDEIARRMRLAELRDFYRRQGVMVGLLDLRRMRVVQKHGLVVSREYNREMIERSCVVDLAGRSEFAGFEPHAQRLNGMDYDRLETVRHHSGGRNEYCVSRVFLDADVVISLPKLKTHKKAGITVSMKNLVGINVDKNYLPHYRIGMPSEGGDEYPELPQGFRRVVHRILRRSIDFFLMKHERLTVPLLLPLFSLLGRVNRLFRRSRPESRLASTHPGYNQMVINSVYEWFLGTPVRAGNWEGNDTIWRMIVDLNKILVYADKEGRLRDTPQRRHFALVDGMVAGAGEGPMNTEPVHAKVLLGGFNTFHIDTAAAQAMGFAPERIRSIAGAAAAHALPLCSTRETTILSNRAEWAGGIPPSKSLGFTPPPHAWSSIVAEGRP